MENQNEIVLKINRDEIFFSCKGYSEEFINTISDIINQRRQAIKNINDAEAERGVPDKNTLIGSQASLEDLKTKETHSKPKVNLTHGQKISTGHKNIEDNKESIVKDIRPGFSITQIKNKYGISNSSFYRLKERCLSGEPAVKPEKQVKKVKEKISNCSIEYRKLISQNREKIIEGIKAGMTFEECRDKWGISSKTTYFTYKKLGKENKKKTSSQVVVHHKENKKDTQATKPGRTETKRTDLDLKDNFVDINKVQQIMAEEEALKKFRPSAKPTVRDWQADMIARGL
jgi:hypothetical protein